MKRQLFRRPSLSWDDVDVQVPIPIAGEGDPPPIGRETWIDIPRGMDGEAPNIVTILVRRPDVPQVGEDDASLMIVRVPHKLGFAGKPYPGEDSEDEDRDRV